MPNYLTTFGNPFADKPLSSNAEEITTVSQEPPQETVPQRLIRELIKEKLSPEVAAKVSAIEEFSVNVLLRDVAEEERKKIHAQMMASTHCVSALNPVKYASFVGAYTSSVADAKSSARIYIREDRYNSAYVIHEVIHWLQINKYLPYNAELTMEATYLVMNCSTQTQEMIPSILAEEVVYPYWRDTANRDQYFQRVLEGKAYEMFSDGWILHPTDPEYHRDMMLYLKYENQIKEEYRDEFVTKVLHTPEGDINDPYGIIHNIGRARAERTYMIGKMSGDMDNAWTVLWLHGRGMPFEEAEMRVAQAIVNKNTDVFYIFPVSA